MKKIKFSKPNISQKDLSLVKKIIKSGWLTHGKFTDLFEKKFKDFTNSNYAITVSSCTAALHLSCLASGFKKGDEVIVPSQSHTATAHAVEYTGAKVIFSEIENRTGNITLNYIKKKITKKTKGVIVVHMAGFPCEIEKISAFCKKNKITLIEDCAHGLGTYGKSKHVGNYGVSGCFSFYPTKQITTGEGGMLITNNRDFFNKAKKLKAFGIDKDIKDRKKPGDYDVRFLGYNYRMTDFQAALGLQQIKRYKKNLSRRHQIVKRYMNNLSKLKEISFMPYSKKASFFVFQIFSNKRDIILNEFKKKGIGVSIHYLNPIHKMTYYKNKYNLGNINLKNTIEYSKKSLSLPVYPKLKFSEIDFITQTIKRII